MEQTDQKKSLKIRKKYAKAKRTFELGIWGHNVDCIKSMTLTTKKDSFNKSGKSRNTWKQLIIDNRHLREKLREEGIVSEDCFCVEISPVNKLLHMHGFYRLKAPYYAADLHKIVSESWEKIHGAKVVWVKDMWDAKGAIKYDVKHAVKNYINQEYKTMRLIKSKGWLPGKWKEVGKLVVQWAINKVDFMPGENDFVSDEYYEKEYVYDKWGITANMLKRWCEGEEVLIDLRDELVLVHGTKIDRLQIEKNEYGEENGEI